MSDEEELQNNFFLRVWFLCENYYYFFFVIVVVHGNLAWDFTMLVGDIKHQQNQNQINSQCSNFGPNCMDLYYSNLREHWQSFYSFLTQDLLPK